MCIRAALQGKSSYKQETTTQKDVESQLKMYQAKLQNLKAMLEVELQQKFMKCHHSSSNAAKFERELQKQLTMKLSKDEKLSLAVYQEKYIQEFIKEKYQVIKANNETLQQLMLGHQDLK